MKRLPHYVFVKDVLYLRPNKKCPGDLQSPWYEDQPVGRNTPSNMMKEISMESGTVKKTNHNLPATGRVPERIIQKAMGHKSVKGLRMYEQASTEQFKYVSKVLMGELPEFRKDNALTTL